MTRAYVRVDPGFYERKALAQGYPLGAVAALVGCFCLGESQPTRGSFRDRRVLGVLLGPGARWIPYLLEHGDLVEREELPRLYIDGWHEWQEGDLTVPERMARMRAKKGKRVTPSVTPEVTAPVTPPVTASRLTGSVIAEAEAQDNSGGGAPYNGAAMRSMSDDQRTAAVADNRRLLSSDQVEVQRAALRSLKRLDPDTDWEAELAAAAVAPPRPAPTARPRGATR